MLLKYILLTLLMSVQLFSSTYLDKFYYVDTKEIYLQTILPTTKNNIELFKIDNTRHSKKVKAKELLTLLKHYGYKEFSSKHSYIKFIQKSPVNTKIIEDKLRQYYKENYLDISIMSLHVEPRSYIEFLPKLYSIKIKKNSFLKKDGVLSIKTQNNKKIFFNYRIKASVKVFISRMKIKKDTELSVVNLKQKIILLDKFRAKPYQSISTGTYQAKHHISENKIITSRDVASLSLVRRKSSVSITMNRDNIDISFSAKALQNGKLNDIIKVQKSNGKVLRVIVTGRNIAEIR